MNKHQLKAIVAEAVGEASMSWTEAPCGVFESDNAAQIVDKIMAAIEEYTRDTDRKKFAGLAMQGLCVEGGNIDAIASRAVRLADALISELEKPKS